MASAILGLLSLPAAPAHAFDTLAEMLSRLPVDAINEDVGGPELYFMSSRLVAGWPPSDIPGVGLHEIGPALLDRDIGVETVGIPFPDLDGILNFGTPPETLIVLAGDVISVADIGDALLRRPNMEQVDRNGTTVFAEGADFAVDLTGRTEDYPFGGGWRAQRVAVWPGGAAVAFAWPMIDAALPQLTAGDDFTPSGGGALLAAMVEAARRAAPANAAAVAASGLGGLTLAASPAFLDGIPDDRHIPPFAYLLLVASTSPGSEATQAVFAYGSRAAAEAGAAALAANLKDTAFRQADCKILSKIVETEGSFFAVVSVVFEPGLEGHPGTAELGRWQTDLFAGRFELFPVGD